MASFFSCSIRSQGMDRTNEDLCNDFDTGGENAMKTHEAAAAAAVAKTTVFRWVIRTADFDKR